MADRVRSQSHTRTTSSIRLSWGTSEASFVYTLPCIKRVTLWHTAQGRCDHGDTVPQYSLINKNSLISFSVYLKQFDMNIKKKKKKLGLNSPKWVVAPLMILRSQWNIFFFPTSTTKLRTFQKTRSSDEAFVAPLGGADTLDDACICGVSYTTQLGDAQDKSSIAWILRISPLLIPLVWPKTGREWWRCGNRLYDRRRGEDTKRAWRRWMRTK